MRKEIQLIKRVHRKEKSVREEESNVRFCKMRSEGTEESRCRKCPRDRCRRELISTSGQQIRN